MARGERRAEAGFALIEALAAVVLMGMILSSLAILTSQWLPAWKRIYDRVQRSEGLAIALDRAADDIANAQFISADSNVKSILFDGEHRSVTFVRSAIGPNSERGLELVRIGDAVDARGFAVARSRVAFTPGTRTVDPTSAAVVLLREPFRLTFEFSGSDGIWRADWQNQETLPAAVLVDVLDAGGRRRLTRIVPVRAQQPPPENCNGSVCGPSQVAANSDRPDNVPISSDDVTTGD